MNMATKITGTTTPRVCRSKNQESSKHVENLNPNVVNQQSPLPKPSFSSSPAVSKSCSYAKSSRKPKNPTPVAYSPKNKIRQRKFIVAKKKQKEEQKDAATTATNSTVSFCKCKDKKEEAGAANKSSKCLCVAYHNLRKSQEEFFKNKLVVDGENEEEANEIEQESGNRVVSELNQDGTLALKRSRERLMEGLKENVPSSGSGKVMNLVKAFEKLLTLPTSNDEDHKEEEEKEPQESNHKMMKWPLPRLQFPTPSDVECSGSPLFCPPNLVLTSQNLGLDPRASLSSSWDSSRGSLSSRTSNGGRRSRRNSLESTSSFGGRRWRKKQQKVTSLKPFNLRTEQRGKMKEEEFVKKIQEMMTEEEKQRIPIAQGLPWTTDEPECLVKPPVKETTIPVDLRLHSDVRALDRAEFDHQVAEKLSFIEQYKLERERQYKLAEEEEVRRLRKELIPKAQPMPYFDRPFIPRRSMKNPTMPREPKFHHKKIKCSSSSWNDMNLSSSYLN